MKLLKIALACSSLVLFWACSQTVSSPDKDSRGDDDLSDIPGFNQTGGNGSTKGSSANVGSESSSSTGGGTSSESFDFPDDGWGDDWFSDFGGGSANTSSGSTGMDVTKFVPDQKMDCTFSLDDDEWHFETVEADSSVDVTIKFKDNGDLWFSIATEGKAQSEEECMQTAALLTVFGNMAAASDETDMTMFATCEGDMLNMTAQGTADEKYTSEQKKEMYDRMCNKNP